VKDEAEPVKIATWNIDRPTTVSLKNVEILQHLRRKEVDADILVLTETNFVIDPGGKYTPLSSDPLPIPGNYRYSYGEIQTTIWSKYPVSRVVTSNPTATVCAKVQTPNGNLNVYCTVIGIVGPIANNRSGFLLDLKKQIEDWRRICREEGNICIVGDFNTCWAGRKSPSAEREDIDRCFEELEIRNLTRSVEDSIDHIAISTSFIQSNSNEDKPYVWNSEKTQLKPTLSDQFGVCVKLELQ
jgi:exonuclease III